MELKKKSALNCFIKKNKLLHLCTVKYMLNLISCQYLNCFNFKFYVLLSFFKMY